MTFPHEPTFAFRSHVFIAASAVAAVLALVLTSLNFTEWLLALVITGPTAGLLYCYARWLARSDGRFLSVHPRKIRGGLLFMPTLGRSSTQMELSCFASTSGAPTSIPP